jgi:hypothetical protein
VLLSELLQVRLEALQLALHMLKVAAGELAADIRVALLLCLLLLEGPDSDLASTVRHRERRKRLAVEVEAVGGCLSKISQELGAIELTYNPRNA